MALCLGYKHVHLLMVIDDKSDRNEHIVIMQWSSFAMLCIIDRNKLFIEIGAH